MRSGMEKLLRWLGKETDRECRFGVVEPDLGLKVDSEWWCHEKERRLVASFAG
jgi:hypothetical protein